VILLSRNINLVGKVDKRAYPSCKVRKVVEAGKDMEEKEGYH
jgi:hypothetical protein